MARVILIAFCIFLSGQTLLYTVISLFVPASIIYKLNANADMTGRAIIAMSVIVCLLAFIESIINLFWPASNNWLRRSHTAIWLLLCACLTGEAVVAWFAHMPILISILFLWDAIGMAVIVALGVGMQSEALRAKQSTAADVATERAAVTAACRRSGDA